MPTQNVAPGVTYYDPSEVPGYPGGLYEYVGQNTFYAPAPMDMWFMNGQWVPGQQAQQPQQPPQSAYIPAPQGSPMGNVPPGTYPSSATATYQGQTLYVQPPTGGGYVQPPGARSVSAPNRTTSITVGAPPPRSTGGKVYVPPPAAGNNNNPYAGFKPGSLFSNNLGRKVEADDIMRAYVSADPGERIRLIAMLSEAGMMPDGQTLADYMASRGTHFKYSPAFYERPVKEIR